MNHLGTKRLTTERLILRKFKDEDAVMAFKNWTNDPEVTKFLTWPPHKYIAVTESYIDSVIDSYKEPDSYNWAIEVKETKEVIGTISVVQQNTKIESVHIGYCIGKEWWHQGYTSEAMARVIKFFMEKVEVNRVESRHDPRNENSGKVMMKCGMKYEGTIRQSDMNNQGVCDACWYGLLKEEYFNKEN